MATYKETQGWIKQEYSISVKSCWIADVKEQCGLPLRKAPNRKGESRLHPCPENKIKPIQTAFKHFGMI